MLKREKNLEAGRNRSEGERKQRRRVNEGIMSAWYLYEHERTRFSPDCTNERL